MRKALVDSKGLVVNVIVIEDGANWSPPDGCILVDATNAGGPGYTWDGRKFVAPLAPAPAAPTVEDRMKVIEVILGLRAAAIV